jgi:uncharacterized membrane protein YeaQ/YmgE (transglycosylase-associated protein family)
MNIVIGIVGSWVGSWLLGGFVSKLVGDGLLNSIITGTLGALVILFIASLIIGKK